MLDRCLFAVILDDDGIHHRAIGNQSRLNLFHLAGDGAQYVCGDKSAGLSDDLPLQHPVTLLNEGFCRSTDVLGKRKYHFLSLFRCKELDRSVLRKFFSLKRMNAANKCSQTHQLNLLSVDFFKPHTPAIPHLSTDCRA